MKKFTIAVMICLVAVVASPVWAQDDIGSKACRDIQLEAHTAVPDNPRNHGQVVSTVARLVNAAVEAGYVTEACADLIIRQFAQRIPIEDQEATGPDRICGDGEIDLPTGEACDDNNMVSEDGCSAFCQIEFCGDSIIQGGLGEQCDDGNNTSGDGCQANCALPRCGDDILDVGEECDDGGISSGDGCSATCTIEVCGNGIVDIGEECDDGNNDDFDSCRNSCTAPFCGDHIVDAGEACDDGNMNDGDGCSATCQAEGPPCVSFFGGDPILVCRGAGVPAGTIGTCYANHDCTLPFGDPGSCGSCDDGVGSWRQND